MRTLCSAQIEKSVLPIMYSNIIIRVSVGASRSLNTMRGSSTMRPPGGAGGAAGFLVGVPEEERVARRHRLLRRRVDVGGPAETRAERQRRHHVEQPAGQVLPDRVVLVGPGAAAVRAELQRGLRLEGGAGGAFLRQLEAQRHEVAVAG